MVNKEDHRFQDGGEEEERQDRAEKELDILIGNILLRFRPNGLTKQTMSLKYLDCLNIHL